MNWLDGVLLAFIFLGAVLGTRIGLMKAAGPTIGLLVGLLLASQLSDDVGALFGKSLSNYTLVTVISYVIIIAVTFIVLSFVWRVVPPLLFTGNLSLSDKADKIGGLVLGLILGLALSGGLIIAMARFAYNFEPPKKGLSGVVAGRIPDVQHTKPAVEGALTASALVPVFIDIAHALPAHTFGFVPSDSRTTLDILQQRIEG